VASDIELPEIHNFGIGQVFQVEVVHGFDLLEFLSHLLFQIFIVVMKVVRGVDHVRHVFPVGLEEIDILK
jgi:hypothetical protein